MTSTPESLKIDTETFEYIIALNSTINESYIASIVDVLKMSYLENNNVRIYLNLLFGFYGKHNKIPNPTEMKLYLTDPTFKEAYKDVITKFKFLDKKYNQNELYDNTEKFIKERAIYDAIKTTINRYTENDKVKLHSAEIYDLFNTACNISLVDDLGLDFYSDYHKHVAALNTNERYLSSGYPWLDNMLGGGFLEKGRALYLFKGTTNVGKSIVLGNIAKNVSLLGKTVVIISLEMSELMYAKRINSSFTQIPFNNLKKEVDLLGQIYQDFNTKNSKAKLIIKEFPPSSINVNHIKAYLTKLKNKLNIKPDLIVIDYLTLLLSTTPSGTLYADGKKIAEQLRALSYPEFFGCSVISACQTSRSGYNNNTSGLDTIGESMGIAHTADALFDLWNTDEEKELGLLHMGVKKSRFGPNFGNRAFKLDYDTLTLREADDVFSGNTNAKQSENTLKKLGG